MEEPTLRDILTEHITQGAELQSADVNMVEPAEVDEADRETETPLEPDAAVELPEQDQESSHESASENEYVDESQLDAENGRESSVQYGPIRALPRNGWTNDSVILDPGWRPCDTCGKIFQDGNDRRELVAFTRKHQYVVQFMNKAGANQFMIVGDAVKRVDPNWLWRKGRAVDPRNFKRADNPKDQDQVDRVMRDIDIHQNCPSVVASRIRVRPTQSSSNPSSVEEPSVAFRERARLQQSEPPFRSPRNGDGGQRGRYEPTPPESIEARATRRLSPDPYADQALNGSHGDEMAAPRSASIMRKRPRPSDLDDEDVSRSARARSSMGGVSVIGFHPEDPMSLTSD